MFVRKSLAGAVTLAVTGSVLALTTGAAHAAVDPDDTTFTPTTADVIGVGSDTSQHAVRLLADSYNSSVTTGGARIATYAATNGDGTGGNTLALPSGAIPRPANSGGGKSLLYGTSTGAGNPDIDFARSSSSLNEAEKSAGLLQFPFALDTLKTVVSGTGSNAPASLTVAQLLAIYKGEVTNWSQVGGTPGVIQAKVPLNGSGTRSFFTAQLTAANGGAAFTFGPDVAEVQEHNPAPIAGNPNAIAPFSAGRAGLVGSSLRVEEGFKADRALYNVIRTNDLGNATLQGIFGTAGYFCSDAALDEIEAAGFKQLDSVADNGACGQATKDATSNFKLNQPVVPIATTTAVTGTSPSAKALRLTANVTGTPTPTGKVTFVDSSKDVTLGTATLIGGTATLNLAGKTPGLYSVTASYTPDEGTAFVASSAARSVRVKAASSISESFASSVSRKATSAKGTVTVVYSGISTKPKGKVSIKEGSKLVGSGTLNFLGKVSVTLSKSKVGSGKSKLTISYPGDTVGFGSSKSFYITFNK
jgi:ABC-type phosphate transport system substrate-binding protein